MVLSSSSSGTTAGTSTDTGSGGVAVIDSAAVVRLYAGAVRQATEAIVRFRGAIAKAYTVTASDAFDEIERIMAGLRPVPSWRKTYLWKFAIHRTWLEYLHACWIRKMSNIYAATPFRRMPLSMSGFLARVGRRKRKGKQ